MSYLYTSNLDPFDRRDQLEIMLDSGDSAILRMGHHYDLTANELARAQRYVIMTFVNTGADEDPIGVRYLPLKGNPTDGQIPSFDVSDGAFVPIDLSLLGAQRTFVSVTDEPFGAEVDGVTNDATALQDAANAIGVDGGTMWIPGHTMWSDNDVQGLSISSNTTVKGTKGVAKIDFSGGSVWRYGHDDACVLVAGAPSGAPIALIKDAKRAPISPIVPTSITRSGTTATVTTTEPHPLSTGDYIYIRGGGSGSSISQNAFYTETNNGVGSDPIQVTVTGASTFTFAIVASTSGSFGYGVTALASTNAFSANLHGYIDGDPIIFDLITTTGGSSGLTIGTTYYVRDAASTFKLAATPGGTAIDILADITGVAIRTDLAMSFPSSAHIGAFGKILVLSSTAGLAEDDMIQLASTAIRSDAASETIMRGQSSLIARVINSFVVVLKDSAQDEYLTSDGATVQKIAPVSNVHFEGIEFIGKGSNLNILEAGDKGIRFDYTRSCTVNACTFRQIDLVCCEFRTSLYCRVTGKTEFICPQNNVSGRVSGKAYVQYGLSFANGTEHLTVDGGCTFHNWRHGIVQASTSERPGVSRNVTIDDCHFFGAWLGAISTHQGFEAGTISNCHFVGCQSAINVRYGERTIIHHNDVVDSEFAIIISKHWNGVSITENMIDRCWTAISTSSQIGPSDVAGVFKVHRNTITNCESPVDIRPTIAGTLMRGVEITHNYIERSRGQAILIQCGDSTLSADGFAGTVSHNTIIDSNRVVAGNAIQCTNARGVRFIGNEINTTSNMSRGIFCDGAATQGCLERASKITGASVLPVDFNTGFGHSSEQMQIETLTISGGSVTPRYRNRNHTIRVDTEAAAATDDLDTIVTTSLKDGDHIEVITATSARAVNVRHVGGGTGNLRMVGAAAFNMTTTRMTWQSRYVTSSGEMIERVRATAT